MLEVCISFQAILSSASRLSVHSTRKQQQNNLQDRKFAGMCAAAGAAGSVDHRVPGWCQDGDAQTAVAAADTEAAAPPEAAPPPAQQHTAALPQQHTAPLGQQQQDLEGISNAFSPAASVVGIRSLPNALHPGYRLELLQRLQAAEKQRQQSNAQASSSSGQQQPQPQQRQAKASASMPAAAAGPGKVPQRYGPLAGFFSCYQHAASEYERGEMVDKFARLSSKLAQVGVDDFVVRGCPPPCQHSTTFATYAHDLPPYTEVDFLGRPLHNTKQQQQQRAISRPPFIPAGRNSSPDVLLKGLQSDLLVALDTSLSKDWPRSFIKAFVDTEGSVVLSFDRAAAACEGDLTSYLNHQESHGSTMVAFRLAKDPSRWGVLEGDGASVFYVLIPPWACRSRPAATMRQQQLSH